MNQENKYYEVLRNKSEEIAKQKSFLLSMGMVNANGLEFLDRIKLDAQIRVETDWLLEMEKQYRELFELYLQEEKK